MKIQAKVSGKKLDWKKSEVAENSAPWTFEKRPGGWVLATRTVNGQTESLRFYYQRVRKGFWAKVPGLDFFGERIEVSEGGSSAAGASDFTAQFPGKVRKILVADGTRVEANTPILMVEAMKMEFAIKSNAAGIVKKVLVQEGQQLSPGQNLVDFAAEPVQK